MPATTQTPGRQLAAGKSSRVWPRLVGRCGTALAQLLFPASCHLCRRDLREAAGGLLLCGECRQQLAATVPVCWRCAMPLPAGMAAAGDSCPQCRAARFRFERAAAIGFYAGVMREAVLRVKQARQEPLALALGRWLGERLAAGEGAAPDVVVAVPMHVSRRLARGINPAAVAAEAVAAAVGVAAAPGLLYCRRKTKKQGMLPPAERRRNVRGAYRLAKGYDITGARVLVVDDVMTTGATANEVSRTLRRGGAEEVSVAVIARGTGC